MARPGSVDPLEGEGRDRFLVDIRRPRAPLHDGERGQHRYRLLPRRGDRQGTVDAFVRVRPGRQVLCGGTDLDAYGRCRVCLHVEPTGRPDLFRRGLGPSTLVQEHSDRDRSQNPRNFAEDIRSDNSWSELDTRADFKANISLVTPFPHDMVSIHLYPGEVLAERFAPGYHVSYSELISLAMEASVQEGRALFVGEFGANDITQGGAEKTARMIQEILDALVENGVPLAAVWVYDRVVTDDESTQGWNITASNSRSYILKAIREANEAISGARN